MTQPNNYVISFSGGRTSAMMTIELLKIPQYENAVVIFANTGKEHENTLKFVDQVDQYIGGRIVWLEYNPDPDIWFNIVSYQTASRNGEPFAALIAKRGFVPNIVSRFCTQDLKVRTIKKYCQRGLNWDHWTNLVGIRYDEPRRWSKSKSVSSRDVFDVEHPLVKMQITKFDVLSYWSKMPFNLDLDEFLGNCDLCFMKGKRKKQHIARNHPQLFDWWIDQEQKTKSQFVKEHTYDQLRDAVLRQPQFDFDDSIECFCNVD